MLPLGALRHSRKHRSHLFCPVAPRKFLNATDNARETFSMPRDILKPPLVFHGHRQCCPGARRDSLEAYKAPLSSQFGRRCFRPRQTLQSVASISSADNVATGYATHRRPEMFFSRQLVSRTMLFLRNGPSSCRLGKFA